jgi:general secretion pathway protein D
MTTLLSALVSGQTAASQKSSAAQSVKPGEITTPGQIPQVPTPSATLQTAMQSLNIGTNEFSTLMTIEADERSNSVVVSGTVDDIRLLRELIDKLDVALAQVRIQVIIAEVTLSDTDISGITALGLTAGQNSKGATQITNFSGSIAGWDLSNGVVNPLAFNAAFNSTSTGQKNVVHVIQAPVIITAHNKAAEVTVGQQVPIINGGQSTLSTSVTPVNSFTSTYQNVAIDLSVTPLIGDNGDIQLTIDQKVDDLGANVTIQAGDVQPVINHREVKSFLTVKDGEMIVLGGLQQTQKSASQAKIGFLYEIPILSQLLGGHTDEYDRTELLFFIRPHIITPEQGTADTERRIRELSNRSEVEQFLKNPGAVENSKSQNLLDRFKSD